MCSICKRSSSLELGHFSSYAVIKTRGCKSMALFLSLFRFVIDSYGNLPIKPNEKDEKMCQRIMKIER